MTDEEFRMVLDGKVAELHASLDVAVANEDWIGAVNAKMESLLLRATAVANEHGVPQSDKELGGNWPNRPAQLMIYLIEHEATLSENFPDPHGARRAVFDAVHAVLNALDLLESVELHPNRDAHLMMLGENLGFADMLLSMAEEGLGAQMLRLRSRQGGRRPGYTAPWRKQIAPEIQKWLEADPRMKKAVLAQKVGDWLQERNQKIEQDSIPKALRAMRRDLLFTWPEVDPLAKSRSKKGN